MFKLPENLDSKYAFISLASARAEQLQTGAMPRVQSGSNKVTVVAQEEVAAGLVERLDLEAEMAEGEAEEEEQE